MFAVIHVDLCVWGSCGFSASPNLAIDSVVVAKTILCQSSTIPRQSAPSIQTACPPSDNT